MFAAFAFGLLAIGCVLCVLCECLFVYSCLVWVCWDGFGIYLLLLFSLVCWWLVLLVSWVCCGLICLVYCSLIVCRCRICLCWPGSWCVV